MVFKKGHLCWNKGKSLSKEIREKISRAKMGHVCSDETKEKIGNRQKGRKHTPEHIAKVIATRRANGWNKNPEKTRRKISIGKKGKVMSYESRMKMSIAKKGWPSPMKGKFHSDESKRKMSISRIGKKTGRVPHSAFKKGHSVPTILLKKGKESLFWKGGKTLSRRRIKAKRKNLGFDALNEPFEGCNAHHIDKTHIIYIPASLHKSVWHAIKEPKTMEQINTKVFCWLLGVDAYDPVENLCELSLSVD